MIQDNTDMNSLWIPNPAYDDKIVNNFTFYQNSKSWVHQWLICNMHKLSVFQSSLCLVRVMKFVFLYFVQHACLCLYGEVVKQ